MYGLTLRGPASRFGAGDFRAVALVAAASPRAAASRSLMFRGVTGLAGIVRLGWDRAARVAGFARERLSARPSVRPGLARASAWRGPVRAVLRPRRLRYWLRGRFSRASGSPAFSGARLYRRLLLPALLSCAESAFLAMVFLAFVAFAQVSSRAARRFGGAPAGLRCSATRRVDAPAHVEAAVRRMKRGASARTRSCRISLVTAS